MSRPIDRNNIIIIYLYLFKTQLGSDSKQGKLTRKLTKKVIL